MKESPFQQKSIMVSGNFAKTVNLQICLGIRFKTKEECYNFLQSLANEVFNRLSEVNMKARGLTLKLLVRAEGAPVVISPSQTHNSKCKTKCSVYRKRQSFWDTGCAIQLPKAADLM